MLHFIFACCIIYWLVSCLVSSAQENSKSSYDPNLDLTPTTYKDIPDNLFQ